MKLFGIVSLALLSIASLVSAFPQKINDDGTFVFWLSGAYTGICDVHSISSKIDPKTKSVNVPSYFVVEGDKYYVRSILPGAFSGADIETITFNSGSKEIYLYDHAFGYNKKIKKIIMNNTHITGDANAFTSVNAEIDGRGARNFIQYFAKKTLEEWNLPVGKTGYDDASTESRNLKMKDLYELAKQINKHFRLDYSKRAENLANAFVTFKASTRGMHMVFRELAIAMGVNEKNILTGGDGLGNFWSYVRFDRDKWYDTWYHAELFMFDFDSNGNDYESFFQTIDKFEDYLEENLSSYSYDEDVHKHSEKWLYYESRYGINYENNIKKSMLIETYIKNLKDQSYRPFN